MSHSRSTVRVTRTLDTLLGVASAAPAAAGILPLQLHCGGIQLCSGGIQLCWVVFGFALISDWFLQVVATAPDPGGREVGLWREIICNFDLLCFTLQVICTPPHHTTPVELPSFPVLPKARKKTQSRSNQEKRDVARPYR